MIGTSKIQMVDLVGQYQKVKSKIDTSIQQVLDSAAFINGPAVKEFGKNLEDYLNVKHVIPCANGTEALQIALMALDLPAGAEIITPDFTFVATVEVVALLGFKPVLVDVDPHTFTIDIEKLREAITPKTAAIIPVHVFGQCADMNAILEIATEHNIAVIEDNAQAIGAQYELRNGQKKKAGTIGTMGTTSFFPSKNLGGYGDGGAIFTNDDQLAEKLRIICNHGQVKQYYYGMVGVNSRLDSIQAAILNVKLKYLDEYISNRQRAAAYYDNAFSANPLVEIPVRNSSSTHVFHQYTLVLDEQVDRDGLKAYLAEKGIPAMIYYPVPLHKQKPYESATNGKILPVTEILSRTVISLPMHTELDDEQLSFIASNVLDYLKQFES